MFSFYNMKRLCCNNINMFVFCKKKNMQIPCNNVETSCCNQKLFGSWHFFSAVKQYTFIMNVQKQEEKEERTGVSSEFWVRSEAELNTNTHSWCVSCSLHGLQLTCVGRLVHTLVQQCYLSQNPAEPLQPLLAWQYSLITTSTTKQYGAIQLNTFFYLLELSRECE